MTPPTWRHIKLRQVGFLQGQAWEQLELPWHSRGKVLFCPGNTAPIISLLRAQPVIVAVHDLSYKYFPKSYHLPFRLWYAIVVPLALYRAAGVITVSETERRAILAHYPMASTRVHAVANGGLPSAFSALGVGSVVRDSNTVLYVGSLSKRKNFPRMLEVACQLARERGLRFIFIGSVSGNLVESAITIPNDISSNISFVGAVEAPALLTSYYRKAACFLFPSLYESSGLPPIEAMACGCPVIASNIPALRERLGDAAIYCDPHHVESIMDAIKSVMDEPTLRSKMQTLGYQRAAKFTWENCARQTLELILKCARSQPNFRKANNVGRRWN